MMAKKTFESALTRLEQISEELEDGNLSLEASLKKFDEGIKLAEFCSTKLTEARTKVEILMEKSGRIEAEPFGDQENDDS